MTPTGYTSFYDQQKQSFKNPYDTLSLPTSAPSTGGNVAAGLPSTTGAGNLAAGPTIQSLSDLINSINRNAQTQANQSRIPGSAALEQQSSDNIGSLLKGKVPGDVSRQLTQQAAERGISIGSPGSDNANASLLQSLGLTGLGLQQTGQQDLTAAEARNPAAPLFNPASQFLTPAQAGELNLGQGGLALKQLLSLLGGGGAGGGGGRGSLYPTTGTSSADNSWWNSLFPRQTSPSSTGTYSSPGDGSTYLNTGQDFTDLFGDPYSGSVSQPPPNTVTTDQSSTYDPFGGYF